MLRNPSGHAVSWAWMCHRGPLSLIGPPCLVSPYRYCVSTARAFSVPGREGGREGRDGRRGGRAEEGGRESGGEGGERERGREQMSVVRGSCGPRSLTKMSAFYYSVVFVQLRRRRGCVCVRVCVFSLGRRRVCFAGMQQSTVKAAVAGACMAAERQQLPIKPINKSFCAVDVCFLLCC